MSEKKFGCVGVVSPDGALAAQLRARGARVTGAGALRDGQLKVLTAIAEGKTLDELDLPDVLLEMCDLPMGLVLVEQPALAVGDAETLAAGIEDAPEQGQALLARHLEEAAPVGLVLEAARRAHRNADAIILAEENQRHGQVLIGGPASRVDRTL